MTLLSHVERALVAYGPWSRDGFVKLNPPLIGPVASVWLALRRQAGWWPGWPPLR
jgi:hypothetical protein